LKKANKKFKIENLNPLRQGQRLYTTEIKYKIPQEEAERAQHQSCEDPRSN